MSTPPGDLGSGADGPPPRLVATDLDGTVVRSDGTISQRTLAALRSAEAAGAVVIFVTGRPPRWMAEVAEQTGHTGVAVCANGAVVYDLHTESVIERFPIVADVARDVATALRQALPGVAFAVETAQGFSREPHYVTREEAPPARVAAIEELLSAGPVDKLLARDDQQISDELLATARKIVGDLVEVTHSTGTGAALVEVSAAGVSKATALARFAAERGIAAADAVAFGDMPNDLAMLGWAGRAYAVANAHPEVLAAVERHTASNDEDGVAQVLERWFAAGPPRAAPGQAPAARGEAAGGEAAGVEAAGPDPLRYGPDPQR